jgi:hypothetical protein
MPTHSLPLLLRRPSIGETLELFLIADYSDNEVFSDHDFGIVHMRPGTALDKPSQALEIVLRYPYQPRLRLEKT